MGHTVSIYFCVIELKEEAAYTQAMQNQQIRMLLQTNGDCSILSRYESIIRGLMGTH